MSMRLYHNQFEKFDFYYMMINLGRREYVSILLAHQKIMHPEGPINKNEVSKHLNYMLLASMAQEIKRIN